MATPTEKKQQPTKSFFFLKFTLIGLLIAAISWLSGIIIFGSFVDLNPKLYARTFMAWRTKGGDAALLDGRYKGYKKNDYPSNDEFVKFLDLAQNKEALLITGNYPLHAPRGPEKLFTLIDEKKRVEDLWRIEFNVKCRLEGKKTETDVEKFREKAKETMNVTKIYDQEFKSKYFVNMPEITGKEIKGFFTVDNEPSVWMKASKPFLRILNKLVADKKDYKFVNGKVSESLYTDIKKFMDTLGYDADEYKNEINNFFLNMATVKATPFETFLYSRLFNLYTFLTINHKFDYKSKTEDSEKNKKNEIYSKERAGIFALIFSNVYEESYNYELKNPTIKERFSKWFGTSQDISKVLDQKDNIQSSLEKADENVKEMTSDQ
jgi:hypothetical protein